METFGKSRFAICFGYAMISLALFKFEVNKMKYLTEEEKESAFRGGLEDLAKVTAMNNVRSWL